MNSKSNQKPVDRRNFIKLSGAGAIAIGTAANPKVSSAQTQSAASASSQSPSYKLSGLVSPHSIETDVVIAGGGMSGVCAALAAARNGARVVLIQDRSVLGGNASSEVRMHIVGADRHGARSDTDSRESGLLEEIRLETAVTNPQRSAPFFDVLLYDFIKKEPNITMMFNTHVFGVNMKPDDTIESVLASRHSTEDVFTIKAHVYLDCTGDGRLSAEAGADSRMGREAQDEYGESLAPPVADEKTLGSSILLTAKKHDRPMKFVPPAMTHKFDGPLPHRGIGSYEYGFWWNEWGGDLHIIKDNEVIRDELLATALGLWDLVKNSGHYKDSENWALEWIGAIPGKRESRRFLGDHVLIEQEVKNGEVFEDGVAFGGWAIDLHPPAGVHSPEPPFISIPGPLYNIPFRCLYSRNIKNLLFAGRNISASHVAFGSTRVMGTCSVMGQAAGTAAALCVKHKCTPRELYKESINELQQTLLKDDAYIIGAKNSDPYDLAREAWVNASSEMPGWWNADNVTNGITRGVGRVMNRWGSLPDQAMPQWIDLQFQEPKRIQEIHLTFDTGLNRQLTLTHADSHHAQQVWGPQPETVRDYEVQVINGESAKTIYKVEGNYQRKRIYKIESQTVNAVRILVHATNGNSSARIMEVRAYA